MHVLLSKYVTRRNVEPLVGLATWLQTLDVEVRLLAPLDQKCAFPLSDGGVSLVLAVQPMRPMVRPSAADRLRRGASGRLR